MKLVSLISTASFFAASSAQYSESDAYIALGYSAIANCPNAEPIRDWTCRFCVGSLEPAPRPPPLDTTTLQVITSTDGSSLGLGFLGYDPLYDRLVVSFQGTTNADQTINNLDILERGIPDLCDDCSIAAGWSDVWNSFGGEVIVAATELLEAHGTSDVLVTGHSMGGAVAAVFAGYISQVDADLNIDVITFGMPRVGNQAFVDTVLSSVNSFYRVVNYLDPIPSMLGQWGDSYRHFPQEIWYNEEPAEGQPLAANSFLELSETDGEDPEGQDSRCEFLNIFKWCTDGSYHEMYLNTYAFDGEPNC